MDAFVVAAFLLFWLYFFIKSKVMYYLFEHNIVAFVYAYIVAIHEQY